MSLVREIITLEAAATFDVTAYSKVGIQLDTITDPDGVRLAFVGSVDDTNWVTAQARRHPTAAWGADVKANTGDIIEVDLSYFKTLRVEVITEDPLNATAHWQSRSFNPTHLVAGPNETDIRAALDYLNTQGGGTLEVLPGTVTLTAPLPIYDGVRVTGATLGALTFTTIPDSVWNFDTGDITLFVGDGTFNAFQHNHVGTGTLPVSQADFANEMVTNWAIDNVAFDNFAAAVHVGAQNRGGGFFFHLRDLLIKNTKVWGVRVTNSMHYEVERIHVVNSWEGGVALFENDVPESILQTGNCFIRQIFGAPIGDGSGTTAKQRRLARGVVFLANHSGGGANVGLLNEVHAYGIQVNQFNRVGLSVSATFTNGSANVTVPDGTEFAVGMPVRFTTTPATNFSTNKIYIVRSVVGNNLQLALDLTSAVISAGSSTSATLLCNGRPAMEVIGTTTGSRVNNSDFYALDLEGGYAAGLYCDRAGTSEFVINQFGSLANNVDLVARGCSNCSWTSLNTTVTDIDGTSSSSYFRGRQTKLDRPGKGFSFETGLNGHIFSVGGSGITAMRVTSGDGLRMLTNAAFGLQLVSRTASLTMGNQNFGHIYITGTTAGQNITLPSASAAAGETNNSGCLLFITNASNQNWTIQTTGGQLFNGVAAKTSFTLPAGQACWISSGGTGYGAILGAALP